MTAELPPNQAARKEHDASQARDGANEVLLSSLSIHLPYLGWALFLEPSRPRPEHLDPTMTIGQVVRRVAGGRSPRGEGEHHSARRTPP